MVPIIWHRLVFFYLACMTLQWKFEQFQASRSKDIVEIAKTWPQYGPDMAILWYQKFNIKEYSSIWDAWLFTENLSNFRYLETKISSPKMDQTYTQYDPTWSLLWNFFPNLHASLHWKLTPFQASRSKDIVEIA